MQMSVDLTLLTIFLVMSVVKVKAANFTPQNCGDEKVMRDARGIIQTPNFPKPFPVPIRCRWVIDASSFKNTNATIYVYFTQMFVTSGVNLTEYVYYDFDTKQGFGKNASFVFLSQEVLEIELVWSDFGFVVIDFELNELEGNHVRVLHNLMNVYGFNITYEISSNGSRKDICTAKDCSFTGHCLASADFTSYNCSCFDGFFGEKCVYGPLCQPDKNGCRNNATCRHVGETAAVCECTARFTGTKCDIPVTNQNGGFTVIDGKYQCPYAGQKVPCECESSEVVVEAVDRARYSFAIHLANATAAALYRNPTTTRYRTKAYPPESKIEEKMKEYFREENGTGRSMNILNITMEDVRKFSILVDGPKTSTEVQNKLQSMMQANVIDRYSSFRRMAPFRLVSVGMNIHDEEIPLRQEFVLSCRAQGSPSIVFQWYKDGIPINASLAVRDLWFHSVMVDASDNMYEALLTIIHAEQMDSGKYTCQVVDGGQQQCRSIKVNIAQIPDVKITPMNVVVEKGGNVTLYCLSKDSWKNTSEYGYSWLRNDKVFSSKAPNLYWEDLHKGGSVLHISNVQQSDVYRCEVVGKRRNSAAVRIDVLDKDKTPYCDRDDIWPMTIPGLKSLQECPAGFVGEAATRFCEMIDTHVARWQLPDYSQCVSNTFVDVTENFLLLTYGYQIDGVSVIDTMKNVYAFVQTRSKLFPGEGEPIVEFLWTPYKFLIKTENWRDFVIASDYFLKIVDTLLQDSTCVVNPSAMSSLTNLIAKWSTSWTNATNFGTRNNTSLNSSHFKSFEFRSPNDKREFVLRSNVTVKINASCCDDEEKSPKVVLMYKNVSNYLLPRYVSNQRDDKQVLYKLSSPIIQVLLANQARSKRDVDRDRVEVEVDFKLPSDATKWDICCGIMTTFGQTWSLDVCESNIVSASTIHCSCFRKGLFALFAAELPNANNDVDGRYEVVVLGCVCCLVQCIVTFFVLLCRWLKTRSCLLYLKIQTCVSTATTMLLFLYGSCDLSIDMYPYVLSGLQMFLLASISSHISVLIVMYIDIISLKSIPNVKVSAITVMTMSPMLLIIFAPLSRRITNERLTCWWLCKGSLLFYIHFIVGLFLLLLFIFLYYSVMKKLFYLWNATKVERRIILQRITFLHYTLIIFLTTAFMVISSTFYVNLKNSTSQCLFGFSSAVLGFVIFVCYVPKNEISFCLRMFPKIRQNSAKYSPELQVIPVQSGILRNNVAFEAESSQSSHSDFENGHLKYDQQMEETSPKPKRKKSVGFHRDLVTGCANESAEDIDETTIDDPTVAGEIEIEHKPDILWPVTQHNYISTSGCAENPLCCSPLHQNQEMLTTRVCVELGVVKNTVDGSLTSNENPSTVVICSVDVEPCPGHIVELNEVKFTTNTLGNICVDNNAKKFNEICKCESAVSTTVDTDDGDKTDVLERISEDLDYLLNRSPSPSKSRKHSVKI